MAVHGPENCSYLLVVQRFLFFGCARQRGNSTQGRRPAESESILRPDWEIDWETPQTRPSPMCRVIHVDSTKSWKNKFDFDARKTNSHQMGWCANVPEDRVNFVQMADAAVLSGCKHQSAVSQSTLVQINTNLHQSHPTLVQIGNSHQPHKYENITAFDRITLE